MSRFRVFGNDIMWLVYAVTPLEPVDDRKANCRTKYTVGQKEQFYYPVPTKDQASNSWEVPTHKKAVGNNKCLGPPYVS